MFPPEYRRRFMVILRAYFDGGTRQKAPRVAYIGGYLGRVQDWIRFNTKWRAFLRNNDLEVFHMAQYVARKGPYLGWSDARRLAVIRRALALITGTAKFGVSTAVLLDDYESFGKTAQQLLGSPYSLCVGGCVAKTARVLHDAGVKEDVAYVFELGDLGQGKVRVAFEELFRQPGFMKRYGILSVNFEDKRRLPGLQTADILAWESGRHVMDSLNAEDVPMRKSLEVLVNAIPHYGRVLRRDDLERMAERRRKKS
jgi:hypothetical protein